MRRQVAARYHEILEGIAPWGEPLRLPVEMPGAKPVYHLYVVRHPKRDALADALTKLGVGTAVHYPMTVPAQPAFQKLGLGKGSFPTAEGWAATCISLPFYPELTEAQQARVAEALKSIR
jgi:dTDP-4-amino-4,6-dideoxygalactose transaminase